MSFSSPFASPLKVLGKSGELVSLELDLSEPLDLFNVDGVPVAILGLSDGGMSKVRFDTEPPRFSGLDTVMEGFSVSKSEFIRLIKASLAP